MKVVEKGMNSLVESAICRVILVIRIVNNWNTLSDRSACVNCETVNRLKKQIAHNSGMSPNDPLCS